MKVLIPGHRYELENFENKDKPGQIIQFIQKGPGSKKYELRTVKDGTTNEEVLDMLIERLTQLASSVPCSETYIASRLLISARQVLDLRTRDRKERGVEGTSKP